MSIFSFSFGSILAVALSPSFENAFVFISFSTALNFSISYDTMLNTHRDRGILNVLDLLLRLLFAAPATASCP